MFKIKYFASKLILVLLLLLVLMTSQTVFAVDKYIVRVIYFKAHGAPQVDLERYDKLIKDMQEWFRNEMIRYGYGDKTFKLENEDNGKLKIHIVNGKHPGEHYTGDLFNAYYEKMSKEIPFFINNTANPNEQDNIYIIIVGGVEINAGVGSTWGRAWNFAGGALGGTAIINENFEKLHPDHYTSIIYHEFGHALLLEHSKIKNSLMGLLPFGGPRNMEDFEARLLNEQHFFNDDHILTTPPEINDNLQVTAQGRNTVRFTFQIKGNANLYHAQLKRGLDFIGSTSLTGKNATADIDVPRSLIHNGQNVIILVLDINGNWSGKKFSNIQLPEPLAPMPDNSKLKYLTIRDDADHSLVPINKEQDWGGHNPAFFPFEKKPNGTAPKLLGGWAWIPGSLERYDSWFYSHAISRFDYDISAWEFNRFDSFFHLPNPCGESVQVICLADDIEIYHSEVLRNIPLAQNMHIQIDIPKDTKIFTIQVTDAGDGARCDHFVFGEAKVLIIDDEPEPNLDTDEIVNEVIDGIDDLICEDCVPEEVDREQIITIEDDLGIDSKNKLTTIWAKIKSRK